MVRTSRVVFFALAACAAVLCLARAGMCEPDLEINGIFIDPKGNLALVNNAMVGEGEEVDGAQVVKITEDNVVFRYEGKEFSQRLTRRSKTPPPAAATPGNKTATPAAATPASSPAAYKSSIAGGSLAAYKPSTPSGPVKMKTLYGMPIEKFFPQSPDALKMPTMLAPGQMLDPETAKTMLKEAQDAKAASEAKKQEVLQHVKEMEGY